MDFLSLALTFGAILLGIAGKLAVSELQDWLPALARKMIHFATKRLPEHARARCQEEWLADNNDMPGRLSKVWHACGCIVASRALVGLPELEETDFTVTFMEILHERIDHYRNGDPRGRIKDILSDDALPDLSAFEAGSKLFNCTPEAMFAAILDAAERLARPEQE